MLLSGRVYSDNGTGINGATVTVYPANSDTPTDSTTTANDSHGKAGYWVFDDLAEGVYKVKIVSGTSTRWLHGETDSQFQTVQFGGRSTADADGLTLHYKTDPTNGAAVSSPAITLIGAYDSDATAGVTATEKKMSLYVDVGTDGTYNLQVANNTPATILTLDGTGVLTVQGPVTGTDFKASGVSVRPYHYNKSTAISTFAGTSSKLAEQEVVIAVKSIVVVAGAVTYKQASSINHGYNAHLREGATARIAVTDNKYVNANDFTCQVSRMLLKDPGTYTYALYGETEGGSTAQIYTTSTRTYLDIIVIPAANA